MISILMTTYNGEKFVSEQIDSLLNQTNQNFKLFINDDASDDSTFSLISKYMQENPDRIIVSQNKVNSGSAKSNFIKMMVSGEYKNDYVMLCDQDDVWLPDKIEVSLAKMLEMETEFGKDTPILVHTDLTVVNDALEVISNSFRRSINVNFAKTKLKNQVVQSMVTGCTVMYNRALAELLTEIPSYIAMHDWWLTINASAFGKVVAIDRQTVLYRQHSKNEIGAKDVRSIRYKKERISNADSIKESLDITYKQAGCFLDMYRSRLSDDQQKLLALYADIPNHVKIVRILRIFRLKTFKNGFSRRVAHLLFI